MNYAFSIVITVYDNARELEEHLPTLLNQQYSGDYEVIVVDETSTDDTPDVLKRLKATYPHLYTTFIPKSSRYPSRRRLALTLGAKAAKYEWVVFCDIQRPPRSEQWLQELADSLGSAHTEIMLGYSARKAEDTNVIYQIFDDVEEARPVVRKTERHSGRGHHGKRFKLRRGQYDFMTVSKPRVHDVIKYFDEHISRRRLMGLRIRVLFV